MAFKQGAGKTTASGTRVSLTAANDYFCSLTIQAKSGNAGQIYIGDDTVTTTLFAFELGPSEAITLTASEGDPINTRQIYLDVATSNDGVTWGGISR